MMYTKILQYYTGRDMVTLPQYMLRLTLSADTKMNVLRAFFFVIILWNVMVISNTEDKGTF